MKLPKFDLKSKFVSLFAFRGHSLVRIWHNFYRQIPRDYRGLIKSHRHFVVFGERGSGKTRLIEGLVEQSQDLYPFEMTWKNQPQVQFYLGPKQVIQEVSASLLDDKSIKLRRRLLRLWKHLFRYRDVTAVVAYNCWLPQSINLRESSKRARSIVGKLTLLSEIRKQAIKVRLVLTCMDHIPGYLEFARFLRKQNISFDLPITTNFTHEALLSEIEQFYATHLTLMLTSVPTDDFCQIQAFFKEFPTHLGGIEEFLRILTSREPKNGPVELESLLLCSETDPNTSFAPFDWERKTKVSIFFKYPLLRHQIAASFIFALGSAFIWNNYLTDRHHLKQATEGIEMLQLLQPKAFVSEIAPKLDPSNGLRSNPFYLPFFPKFFRKQWLNAQNDLAEHIREHIFEPMLRRILLDEASETNCTYMLGLIHSAQDNRLGDLIRSRADKWSKNLGLDTNLILTYANYRSSHRPVPDIPIYSSRIDLSSALCRVEPWIEFLEEFQQVLKEPAIQASQFQAIGEKSKKLYKSLLRLRSDEFVFTVCNHLSKMDLSQIHEFKEQIATMLWIRENIEGLEHLLTQINFSITEVPNIKGKNISRLFAGIKDVSSLRNSENRVYKFASSGKTYTFELKQWVDHVVTYVVEQMLSDYITQNNESKGEVFFAEVGALPSLRVSAGAEPFPAFQSLSAIPGKFQRVAFESNVRQIAEKLLHLIEDLPIHPETKLRFTHFLSHEVVSYVREYQKVYADLFQNCYIEPISLADFKVNIAKAAMENSSFHTFLKTIYYQTAIFDSPTPSIDNLSAYNDFAFLKELFPEDKSVLSLFDEYSILLRELVADLNQGPKLGGFDGLLTPVASISLNIFRGTPNSYLVRLRKMLNDRGVPEKFHGPFIAPVEHVYAIGLSDLKQAFEMIWEGELKPQVTALFAKFPFNKKATEIASFDEVNRMLNPRGEFWSKIHSIYGVVSKISGNQWKMLSIKDLEIESTIHQTLSSLASVSSLLWDHEGNPKPLILSIKGEPFDDPAGQNPVMVLSSIVTGGELFHNGNQNPTWHTIKVHWWKEGASAVVIELLNQQTYMKMTRDVRVTGALWSFFHLLSKAEQATDTTWQWSVSDPTGQDIRHVGITFDKNPWDIMSLEQVSQQEALCARD